MPSFIFNSVKGSYVGLHNNVANNSPSNSALVLVLLKSAQGDDDLNNYTSLSTLLANAGNVEADFTNYARIVLTDAELSAAVVDDANNRVTVSAPDQTITSAGGTVDNTTAKILLCYDDNTGSGTDADLTPVFAADFVVTTQGTDLLIDFDATTGYGRSV